MNKILNQLSKLKYTVFWPNDNWKDIGFTENAMWANSYGYGYFADDEPSHFGIIGPVTSLEVANVKRKAKNNALTLSDIKNTKFEEINFSDDDWLEDHIDCFKGLPDDYSNYIYFGESVYDGMLFFSSEAALSYAFNPTKDECFELWEEMDANMQRTWLDRLSSKELIVDFPFTNIFKEST